MTDSLLEHRTFQSLCEDDRQATGDGWVETTDPWDAVRSSALSHRVRWHTGLSQAEFAEAYRIDPDRLRALERGEVQPDGALVAYLTVIDREPAMVRDALRTS
jgi:putative transcriptional regulator